MNRIRNFLSGDTTNNTNNGRNNTNNNNTFGMSGQRRYNNNNNDNLYLSDDEDDWGMSAYGSDTRRYAYTERRTSSSNTQFWDQSSISEDMQAWERQAEADNVSQFEIGNDDYYHSDTHRKHLQKPHIGHHNEQQQPSSYDDVEHEIQTLEDTEADNESSAASNNNNKEEVVNAYRDYLKSIRDGGFESYLNKNEEEEGGQVLSWKSDDQIVVGGGDGEDEALERVLDMEEERRATSSLYSDNLYGSASDDNNGTSPYSAWRAKAKALLRQEEERERSSSDAISSPSRQILDKFRRKRSRDGSSTGSSSGMSRQQQQNGYYDQTNNGDHSGMTDKLYSYKNAIFQKQRIRGVCIGICLILALTAGLSYYGGKNSSTTEENDTISDNLLTSPALPDENNQNDAQSFAPSDAVLNSLKTFDPVWYDRHQGWEGITFADSVEFCAAHDNRVPCPYEIYCNEAENGDPYRGNRPNGEQWSAVSNSQNQWVQVGGTFTCHRYTDLYDQKKPEWGITGVSMELKHGAGGITQNIMCCRDVHHISSLDPAEWGKHTELDHVDADSTNETTNIAVIDVEDESHEKDPLEGNLPSLSQDLNMQKREKMVISAFQPIWFSSAHGWSGGSYEDAILFCESYNHMVLCPYAAYCPAGKMSQPLPGSMVTKLDGEEWVPANGPINTWIQIGTLDGDESTQCTLHHETFGERPQFGVDGTRTDVKHHIMCCLM